MGLDLFFSCFGYGKAACLLCFLSLIHVSSVHTETLAMPLILLSWSLSHPMPHVGVESKGDKGYNRGRHAEGNTALQGIDP